MNILLKDIEEPHCIDIIFEHYLRNNKNELNLSQSGQ